MKRRDLVTRAIALEVLQRDQGCLAPRLGGSAADCRGRLTLDHVRDHAAMGGRRAPSDPSHLATLCEGHHLQNGWATSHKPLLREYLREVTA